MARKWYFFPSYGNVALAKILLDRARELGYKIRSGLTEYDVSRTGLSLPINSTVAEDFYYGVVNRAYDDLKVNVFIEDNDEHHEVADIGEFLFTDKFRFKKPIKVVLNEQYTAEVNGDEIKVGCQSFSVSKLKELMKAIEENK